MSDKISDEMAAEAWRGVHEGLQRFGAESEAIDTLCDYFDQAHPTDEEEAIKAAWTAGWNAAMGGGKGLTPEQKRKNYIAALNAIRKGE